MARGLRTVDTRVAFLATAVVALVCLCLTTSFEKLPRGSVRGEYLYLSRLKQQCGQLCHINAGSFVPSLHFQRRIVRVDCPKIFAEDVFLSQGHGKLEAPRKVPESLENDFTIGGQVQISEAYHDQMYLNRDTEVPDWSKEMVNEMMRLTRAGQLEGYYGVNVTQELRKALEFANGVRGGHVLVIGSSKPWVEAVALVAGAKSVVTLEYGEIRTSHPDIATLTPVQFRERFISGKLGLFDAIISYSSVEHSGLGRYGDALNPWGDVLEIARAHCVCKPFGSLIIGVPTSDSHDTLVFNAHRVYGNIRWPYLATNWQLVYRQAATVSPDSWDQRIHIFMKIDRA